MESILENFSAAFSVSTDPNDTAAPHPRLSQYKEKPCNVPDQTTRRSRMLEQQKRRRHDFANYSRKLADGVLDEEDVEEFENEEMEFTHYKEKRKKFNPYAYQLMLSEWLVDVPEDLADEWLMVICPHGRRNLVIASNGITSAYTKSGFRVNQFTSHLPGGSPNNLKPGEYTILDCIFNEVSNTFYVQDIMCWRGHPVFDCETEFRFYWLQTKLKEEQGLVNQRTSSNPYKFIGLSFIACTPEQIKTAIDGTSPNEVDGLLFYHKRTHYVKGRTPLVGWLKVHMVPEILGIDINPQLTARNPRVDRKTLIKNNLELKETTDDKTAEERAEYEKRKGDVSQMEVDRNKSKGRWKKGSKESNQCDRDSNEGEEFDELNSTSPMEVSSGKSRRRRRRRNKKEAESMNIVEEEEKEGSEDK